MNEAEINSLLSLLLITLVVLLAIGVRALWGKRTPRPSAKNNWRKIDDTKSRSWSDNVESVGGDPAAGGDH